MQIDQSETIRDSLAKVNSNLMIIFTNLSNAYKCNVAKATRACSLVRWP